eukprot:m.16219 g.16219  ORF g.16219 m.16219 type:complete len:314 (-) comp5184_c0_seq1:104-1045(-)
MDKMRVEGGDRAVDAAWKRVWTGFLAFDGLGTLGTDIVSHVNNMPTPHDAIIQLIKDKSQFGAQNHRSRRLGNHTINSLFGNPELFVDKLAESAWVVAGHDNVSPLMSYLTSFDGPMFKIFDPKELQLWRNWIVWLGDGLERQSGILNSYEAMRKTMERVGLTAMSQKSHRTIMLWGPAANEKSNEEVIEQPVSIWLSTIEDDPTHIMKAIIHPKNKLVVCGRSDLSRFYTHVIAPNNPMGDMFWRVAAEASSLNDLDHKDRFWSWADIVQRWIDDGCPLEDNGTFSLFPRKYPVETEKTPATFLKSGKHSTH